MTTTKRLCFAGLLSLGAALPVLAAGDNNPGIVTVDVRNVSTRIAGNINVDANQLPGTVQLPIGVAAQVCGIDANLLAERNREGNARCAATTTTTALDQAVQRQMKAPHGARADAKGHIGSGTEATADAHINAGKQKEKGHTEKGLRKEK